jgi:hypothetical protein
MSATKSKLEPLFQYQHAREKIDRFIRGMGDGDVVDAWELAQEIIEAQTRHHQKRWSEDVSRAKAWEDFEMAWRGRASAGISGAVFHMWAEMPVNRCTALIQALEGAFKAAHERTDPTLLRYGESDRKTRIQTLDDGYDLPPAIPYDRPIPAAAQRVAQQVVSSEQVMEFASRFSVIQGGKCNPPN